MDTTSATRTVIEEACRCVSFRVVLIQLLFDLSRLVASIHRTWFVDFAVVFFVCVHVLRLRVADCAFVYVLIV
jgi:hypothetical protein